MWGCMSRVVSVHGGLGGTLAIIMHGAGTHLLE